MMGGEQQSLGGMQGVNNTASVDYPWLNVSQAISRLPMLS